MMPMCLGSRLKLFIVVSCVCQPPVALLSLARPGWAVAAPHNGTALRPVQDGDARPRTTRIAASWDQPCHEKTSRRAKAVVWVRQVIQATTGRPLRLCYSGSTAATRPLSTCSTARPGSPGTSGTTGRVLLLAARASSPRRVASAVDLRVDGVVLFLDAARTPRPVDLDHPGRARGPSQRRT